MFAPGEDTFQTALRQADRGGLDGPVLSAAERAELAKVAGLADESRDCPLLLDEANAEAVAHRGVERQQSRQRRLDDITGVLETPDRLRTEN